MVRQCGVCYSYKDFFRKCNSRMEMSCLFSFAESEILFSRAVTKVLVRVKLFTRNYLYVCPTEYVSYLHVISFEPIENS